jgi:hypothetical protein
MIEVADPPTALPPPPRPLTVRVRRRAWADPLVRFWWLTGSVLLILGIYLGASIWKVWHREQWLISQPLSQAQILRTASETIANRPVKEGQPMQLQFNHRGALATAWVRLEEYDGKAIIGESIPIHVNPENPAELTLQKVPRPLGSRLVGPMCLCGFGLGGVAVAWLVRLQVLRTVRQGSQRIATRMARQQSPLAPLAHSIQCAWADPGHGRRLFTVYLPRHAPEAAGSTEHIRVIAAAGRSCRPLAAAWFE